MKSITMYDTECGRDHIDRLYDIVNLAKVGAAATDTGLNIAHLDSAQCCLFEVIYALASEAVEIAELKQDEAAKTKNEVK